MFVCVWEQQQVMTVKAGYLLQSEGDKRLCRRPPPSGSYKTALPGGERQETNPSVRLAQDSVACKTACSGRLTSTFPSLQCRGQQEDSGQLRL